MNQEAMKYEPISCDFYDYLEIWAMRQTECIITYSNNGKIEVIRSKIKDIRASNGEEHLYLQNEQKIRLDHLIEINGKAIQKFC